MTLRAPPPQFPLALDDDADDVAWALRTAGVQWSMGERKDAIEWLLRAVDTAIDAGRIERAREIQRGVNDLSEAVRAGSGAERESARPPAATSTAAGRGSNSPRRAKTSSLPPLPLPPPPGFEEMEAETLDVDVDIDIEEEIESLEVLEPEIIDEVTVEEVADDDDELSELDIEALADGTLEVDRASIRVAEAPEDPLSQPPSYALSEAPTNLTPFRDTAAEALPQADVALIDAAVDELLEADEPMSVEALSVEPAELSETSVPNETLPSMSAPLDPMVSSVPVPNTTSLLSDMGNGAPSTPPGVRPRREPWRPSPSFGENLAPPPSVVFRAASSAPVVEDEPLVPSEPEPAAPPPRTPSAGPPAESRALSAPPKASVTPESAAPPSLLGIRLSDVPGLEDLPEDSQDDLARSVDIHLLDSEEEVTGFGLALVLAGRVAVMPAVMDVVCVQAGRGELVFAEGHVSDGVALKVVASEDGTRVASWPIEHFAAAIAACPWVRDELRRVGDKLQALAGAAMGPMGEKLDEQLRGLVLERCTVKLLLAGESVAEAGRPLAGMTIVGAGRLEVLDQQGKPLPDAELGPGDFVFPSEMLRAAKAPANVRAGSGGALIVFADRKTAHELLMSVPPLIEVLSE